MANLINLEIAVDTGTLFEEYPNLSRNDRKPTTIDPSYCYMIGAPGTVVEGQATEAMTLALCDDDKEAIAAIRWRSLSLSGNSDTAAVLYDIVRSTRTQSLLGEVQSYGAAGDVPIPILVNGRQTDPPSFSDVETQDYYLEAAILRFGVASLRVRLYLTTPDPQNGMPMLAGYVQWPAVLNLTKVGKT